MVERTRRRAADQLGLRSALADRLLPVLVAAMSFLAALALAGTIGTALLAAQWRDDTASTLTIQVPDPDAPDAQDGNHFSAVLTALRSTPGVENPQPMSRAAIDRLLSPWLGADAGDLALPIPAVISAEWAGPGRPDTLAQRLDALAPGTLVASGAAWANRVAALTASLQACAAAVLVIVLLVAVAMVSLATRSGLAQRRETIEIIHGLGAQDSDIADRFAVRATLLTVVGAGVGTLLALPVLFWLAAMAAPFAGFTPSAGGFGLPLPLWAALPILPLVAAVIGWATAQVTVRGWLRRMS